MKYLLFASVFFLTLEANSQSLNSIVSNHVFVMCDEYGTPSEVYDQYFYMVFHSNGTINLLCGSTLDKAIDNGSKKLGTWSTSGGSVSWRWSDSGEGGTASRNGYSENLVGSGGGIFKNLGGF
jgi:hypothetical protein